MKIKTKIVSLKLKNLFLVFLVFACSFNFFAQNPEELVKRDYPKLYTNFKTEVGGQKARYVFAIDISNSMKPYELAVKTSLQNFINALPDGDFVSIVQMASSLETRSILENQPVNSSTRNLILSYINGLNFNKVGSDGYTMTTQIIEKLNQTGSSDDMKYVFMFTDFEYWTKENQFKKNAVDWNLLAKKIKINDGFLKVYGLELFVNGGVGIRKDAVYKNELNQIFGNVEYVSGDNSTFLNTWFNNTKANILNERLKYVLNRKTEKQNAKLVLKAFGLGKDLKVVLKESKMSSVYTIADLDAESLSEVQKTSEKRPLIGSYNPKPVIFSVKAKLRSPEYKNEEKSTPNKEYNEVDRLLEPNFTEYKIEVFEGEPYIAWYIGWPFVVLLVFWIGSIVFHLITFRSKRNWRISASFYKFIRDEWDWNKDLDTIRIDEKDTFTISENSANCSIQDINATFEVTYKRNLLCIPFINKLKRGYHLNPQRFSGKLEVYVNSVKKDSSKDTIWIGSSGNSFKGCELVLTSSDIVDQTKKKIKIS